MQNRTTQLRILSLLALLFCVFPAKGQTSLMTDSDQSTGIHSYQTYDGIKESIDLQSGNLHFCLNLIHIPGRNGHDLDVPLCFNSQFTSITQNGSTGSYFYTDMITPGFGWGTAPGWSLIGPTPIQYWTSHGIPQGNYPTSYTQCTVNGYNVITSNGTAHSMPGMQDGCRYWTCPNPGTYNPQPCTSSPIASVLMDASYEADAVVVNLNSSSPSSVYFPDNTRITGLNWTDSNGNGISTSSWSDTLGRQINVSYPTSTSTAIAYPGPNGTTESIVLNQGYIVLPNGLTYIVQEDSNGEVTKVVYPSGGYTRYVYTGATYNQVLNGYGGPVLGQKFVCNAAASAPGSTSVGTGNTCPIAEQETDYYNTASQNDHNNTAVTVVDPAGDQVSYTFSSPISYLNIPGVELSRSIYSSNAYRSGAPQPLLLKTVQTQYSTYAEQQQNRYTPSSSLCKPLPATTHRIPTVPTCVVTQIGGAVSKVESTYDIYDMADNTTVLLETREYDYPSSGPPSPLRTTDYTWLDRDYPQQYGSALLGGGGANILNQKTSVIIKDGSGNIIAQSKFIYDGNYGGGPGNLTASQVWRNTDGKWLQTNNSYDSFGNIYNRQTPLTTSTYSYSDNYNDGQQRSSNAYITSTSQTINGITLTSRAMYDFNSGLVTAECGPNFTGSTCTVGLYNVADYVSFGRDSMGRVISEFHGDGGGNITCYSESGCSGALAYSSNGVPAASQNNIMVTNNQKLSGTPQLFKVTTQVLNGLGQVQNTLVSDTSCNGSVSEVDTLYDPSGRVATMSNPYCTINPAPTTTGSTTYTYDGLSRPTLVTYPDGSQSSNLYSGRAVQSTSPARSPNAPPIVTITQIDGAGQIAAVCESTGTAGNGTSSSPANCGLDVGATGFLTGYTHDILGNLTGVQQGAVSRSYAYDSLSKMQAATDPERGTTQYQYDQQGVVNTKLLPVGGATYQHDGLGRVTSIVYSNSSTPSACYTYDSGTNGLGRLVEEWTQDGACSPMSHVALTDRRFGYDSMGRLATDSQCSTPGNCSSFFTVNYSYDLAGNLLSWDNGLTGASYMPIQATYDSTSRVTSIRAPIAPGGGSTFSLLSVTGYSQAGGIQDGVLGTAGKVHRDYDSRLRPVAESHSTLGQPGQATVQLSGKPQLLAYSLGTVVFGTSTNGEQSYVFNGQTFYDQGNFVVTVGSQTVQINYGQNDTPQSLATSLAAQFSCAYGKIQAYVIDSTVYLESCYAGVDTGYTLAAYADGHASGFQQYSFSVVASNTTMAQATSATPGPATPLGNIYFSGSYVGNSSGAFLVIVNSSTDQHGPTVWTVIGWDSTSTATSMASYFASTFRSCSTSGTQITASVSGAVVSLSACQPGATITQNVFPYGPPSAYTPFMVSTLPAVPAGIYDSGTVNLSVNGSPIASAAYTSSTLVGDVVSALVKSNSSSDPVVLSGQGSSLTIMTSDPDDASASYQISSTQNPLFSQPSFTASAPSGSLMGSQLLPVYNWSVSYAPNSNIAAVSDSVLGSWNYYYDDLNRLSSATANTGPEAGLSLNWNYDRYGNRWSQSASGSGSASQASLSFGGSDNHATELAYDGNGNVTGYSNARGYDTYGYDSENRLSVLNGKKMYIYDAEGKRVAKLNSSGSVTSVYVLGAQGQTISEVDGNGNWVGSYLYHPNGSLIGNYLPHYGYFLQFTDLVGTKRMQADITGSQSETCINLPFGDSQTCDGPDFISRHLTGKERDSESQLDYFGARYLTSSLGRFTNPDPSQLYFADPTNPQSHNLYSYVLNNPLRSADPDGLDACVYDGGDGTATIVNNVNGGAVDCPGDGFYITTTEQVTGVGFNRNGDVSVYGTDTGSGLYNPDGSLYNVAQGITVFGNDAAPNVSSLPAINNRLIQYAFGVPDGFAPVDLHGAYTYGSHCGPGGQGAVVNTTDAACFTHDICYAQNGFTAGSNFARNQSSALQGCNQSLVNSANARAEEIIVKTGGRPTGLDRLELDADRKIAAYFTSVPFGNAAR